MEPHLAGVRVYLKGIDAMAKSQEAHKTGGGIGGKTKREASEAKKARRVSNLAARADENRTRQKGSHQAPKAKK
jgi:hypothetical protein